MERIAAGPPHDPGVGVGAALAVIVELAARVEQQIGDPRHGDEVRDLVAALRQRGPGQMTGVIADRIHRGVAEAYAAAGQPDVAEHRGQRHPHPERLLAVVLPGQRPCERDHRAPRGHAPGKSPNRLRVDAGDRLRPARVLRGPVPSAGEIENESLEPDRVFCQERLVMQTFGVERVSKTEHERDVGAGPGRHPLRTEAGEDVVSERRDVDERDPGIGRLAHVIALDVPSGAAGVDLAVLHRQSAERDHQVGVLDDRRPARVEGSSLNSSPMTCGRMTSPAARL